VHDLNNTLTGLLAHVDTLRAGASPEEAARLDRIADAILRAARTGRHVATLVRDGASPEGPQDPGPIVRDTASWIVNAHPRRVQLQLDLDDALPRVHARATDIEQILVNLVGNAVKASPPDGTVRVSAHSDATCLHLTVEDEGGGVPPEARARVWEPFFTTRPDGTGIGLSVVARIARDLGGDVALEDGARGARFRVSLPLTPGRTPRRPRVALVSDDAARHARLRAMLRDRGFDVDEPGGRHDGVAIIDAPDDAAMEAAGPWLARAPATVCVFVRPESARGEVSAATCVHEPLDAERLAAGVRRALFTRQAERAKNTTAPVV
jgi:anti-sigma regulatory factor (Ser/Thr protein kinase)